jgi:hypothetical protein
LTFVAFLSKKEVRGLDCGFRIVDFGLNRFGKGIERDAQRARGKEQRTWDRAQRAWDKGTRHRVHRPMRDTGSVKGVEEKNWLIGLRGLNVMIEYKQY